MRHRENRNAFVHFSRIMTLFHNKVWLGVLLLFPIVCSTQTLTEKIDSIVHAYDSAGGYNGIIIVGLGADSILTFEYGYANPREKKEQLTLTDRFDLASDSKQFTGLAILQLVEKGLVQPDDTIGTYFPELQPALRKATVKQLANHTNGIHDFYSLTTRHDTLNKQEALTLLSQLDTTVFAPGSKWGYSNSGYLLLSELIERITKMTFQEYCENYLFAPLNMSSACFLNDCEEYLKGYDRELNPITYNSFSSGEAGMYVSGNDILAYYQTVCKNPEQWDPYFSLSYELSEASNAENWNYGFGWFFTEDRLGKFRAHSGRNWGAHAYIRWYEGSNTFLCLLSNKKSDAFFKPLREELANLLIRELAD